MSFEAITGIVASAAGAPAAAHASRADRASAISQAGQGGGGVELDTQNLAARDRDADGRLPWQANSRPANSRGESPSQSAPNDDESRGTSLDVTA